MREVSKEAFYKAISGPENIHPRSERAESVWEIQGTRQQVGRSEPGYASPHGTPCRYWLTDDFAKRKEVA